MAEILTYSSDKLTRLLARLKRKAGGRLSGIKRCEATLEKIREFFEDKGYLPKFYNPYNNAEITDITPTLTANCDRITNSATVLVFENSEKGSDNLTETLNLYDADEQADFTQTEAEEWAAEIALRIKEGNLDPIPKNKSKKFGQYDFTYASLFSGIGGFEQALNKFGGECVFASEIDKFAAQAYETLYGHKPAGDITKIDAKDIPDHDLLVGGFPCQAFSVAGRRKGFEDTRGTLFFDIARIAAEKKPKALLLENVKGLVNHDKGNTLDTMIQTLNDIGYVIDFEVLNSKYFGVPQNRERIFIVAVREDLIEAVPFSEEATKGNTIVPKGKRRIGEWADVFNFDWPEQAEVSTKLRDILESNVDEKYYLDEERTAKLVAQLEGQTEEPTGLGLTKQATVPTRLKDESNTLAARDYKGFGNQEMTSVIEPQMLGHREPKIAEIQYPLKATCLECRVTYYVDCGCSCASYVGEDGSIVSQTEVLPVLTPDRMEKRQNGRRFKEDGEESFTLTAQDQHGVALGERPRYRIRKLTPLECFRLQNFPDEAHQALVDAGISDSQRYKMAGNAVTTSVIEAIGQRLIPLISSD